MRKSGVDVVGLMLLPISFSSQPVKGIIYIKPSLGLLQQHRGIITMSSGLVRNAINTGIKSGTQTNGTKRHFVVTNTVEQPKFSGTTKRTLSNFTYLAKSGRVESQGIAVVMLCDRSDNAEPRPLYNLARSTAGGREKCERVEARVSESGPAIGAWVVRSE